MPFDPLADTIVRPPVTPGVPPPDEAEGRSETERQHLERERKRHDLLMAARRFARHDDIAASPFGAMRRGDLLVAARIAEVPNADRFSDAELRAVLLYCDRKRVEAGGLTLAPAPIGTTVQPTIEAPPAPVMVPGIPRSKSNKWRVVKGGQVAMAGGIYTVAKDTIVGLDQGIAHVQNLIDHGLTLEPWPSAPPSVTCPTCDTTRLVASLETGEPYPEGCPMCGVLALGDLSRLGRLAASYDALLEWAIRRGAPPPGPDGTWDGELHPPEPALAAPPPTPPAPAPAPAPAPLADTVPDAPAAPTSARRGKADR